MVHEPIDGGRRRHRVLEDAFPFTEHQIAGHQQRAAFVALRDQREQHLGFLRALLDVPNVINDEQLERIELVEQPWQGELLLGRQELLDELIGGAEQHRVSVLDQSVPQRTGGMTLSHAGQPEAQHVHRPLQKLPAPQLNQALL